MSPGYWDGRRVLITGGHGFLGRYLVETVARRGSPTLFSPRSSEYDLRRPDDIASCLRAARPDIVIHLAAVVGGIGANRRHPGRFFYENAFMGIELMEQARRTGVKKFVCLGTVCAYPRHTLVPFCEEELWNGYPEETNAPYGLAKKMLLVQAQAYRQEYGFNAIYLLPVNLYGPGDNFDLESSHVIPALVRKFVEAEERGESHITAWGTGTVSREFLYVEDAALAIAMAAESYDSPEPVNLGAGDEITIRDLAEMIRRLTGFKGSIEWDQSQPDGQPRRCLDTSRAECAFGFRARTSLEDGLTRTIAWYRQARRSAGDQRIVPRLV